jgi:hypothetical protein
MKHQLRNTLVIVGTLVLTVVVFTGNAMANPSEPSGEPQSGNGLARMVEWMGPENWGQMVQHMTQIHGVEETGRMLQWMNQSGGCHNSDSAGSMVGRGFGSGMGFRSQGGVWNDNTDEQSGYGFQRGAMGPGMN